MNAKRFSALLLVAIVLAADTFLPVYAGHHHRGNHGIELLLAAGILAKLLHKKGHHHHHHHGHHGHHHHHGSGSRNVEMMHAPPAMGGYDGAATSFASSVDYPAASHAYPVPPMPYMGYEPQPMAYGPPAVPHH